MSDDRAPAPAPRIAVEEETLDRELKLLTEGARAAPPPELEALAERLAEALAASVCPAEAEPETDAPA